VIGGFYGNWTLIPESVAPPARAGASLAYLITERYLVLFGGYVPGPTPGSRVAFNDTWEFKDYVWTEFTTPRAPSPRFGAAFEDDHWDANDTTPFPAAGVLFGGETANGSYLGDTWVFSGGSWTELTGVKAPSPGPRAFAMIGDDETDGNVEMFGGTNGYAMSDLWTFF
jgi:galactose oxidase-like protein